MAAGATQYVIDRHDPEILINLGTCGGFAAETGRLARSGLARPRPPGQGAKDDSGLRFTERAATVMNQLLRDLPRWILYMDGLPRAGS
jgi:hypothetical protein